MTNKHYLYEKNVIDVIINLIKENHVYLTQTENLPQLAKLGYIYNKLYGVGRRCWGYDGLLRDGEKRKRTKKELEENRKYKDFDLYEDYSDCESNFRDKIETDFGHEIDKLIYASWCMHIETDGDLMDYNSFYKLIIDGEILTEIEHKLLKENKTFDDWYNILTDKNYKYNSLYETRKRIYEAILWDTRPEYSITDLGFVSEICVDMDILNYGDWKNAKLRSDIEKTIIDILNTPEVKISIETTYVSDEKIMYIKNHKYDNDNDKEKKLVESIRKLGISIEEKQEKYSPYYGLWDKFDRNDHSVIDYIYDGGKMDMSYIKECVIMCKEIIEHEKEETESNVLFAGKFLDKFSNI